MRSEKREKEKWKIQERKGRPKVIIKYDSPFPSLHICNYHNATRKFNKVKRFVILKMIFSLINHR